MKNLSWKLGAVGAAALAIGVAAAASADDLVTANVPFAFVVGARVLPPGNYMIEDATEGATVVRVEREDGTESAFTFTIAAPESPQSKGAEPQLAFAKVGDTYYLKSIAL